jgi:hypothetical protein
MAEASDILSNRRGRLSKRRKLNIDNAIQEDDDEIALVAPKNQQARNWTGGPLDPIVIDLTACDDTPATTPVPQTPQSDEISEDEIVEPLSEATTDEGFARKATFVQVPRPCLTEAAFFGWHPPDTLWSEFNVLTKHSDGDEVHYFDLDDFTIYREPSDRKRAMEMATLDRLQTWRGVDNLCFSGRLFTATASYYVHNVKFSTLAVDGYGVTKALVYMTRYAYSRRGRERATFGIDSAARLPNTVAFTKTTFGWQLSQSTSSISFLSRRSR